MQVSSKSGVLTFNISHRSSQVNRTEILLAKSVEHANQFSNCVLTLTSNLKSGREKKKKLGFSLDVADENTNFSKINLGELVTMIYLRGMSLNPSGIILLRII